jgi:hypothetical protein
MGRRPALRHANDNRVTTGLTHCDRNRRDLRSRQARVRKVQEELLDAPHLGINVVESLRHEAAADRSGALIHAKHKVAAT